MRSKSIWLLGLMIVAYVAAVGCSSEPPKTGVPIQAGDYAAPPGGGKNPNAKPK